MRLINKRTGLRILGGIGCLGAIALLVLVLVLQREINRAVAYGVLGGPAECHAHAKATGRDSQGLPKGPVTAAFVAARPNANLVYPGATVLKRSSSPEVVCPYPIMSLSRASTEIEFSTGDQSAAVNHWYEARLAAEGWRECAEELRMPTDRGETFRVFHRGRRESYSVDHSVPSYPSPPPSNVFTVTYSIDRYTDESTPPGWTEVCTLVAPTDS